MRNARGALRLQVRILPTRPIDMSELYKIVYDHPESGGSTRCLDKTATVRGANAEDAIFILNLNEYRQHCWHINSAIDVKSIELIENR